MPSNDTLKRRYPVLMAAGQGSASGTLYLLAAAALVAMLSVPSPGLRPVAAVLLYAFGVGLLSTFTLAAVIGYKETRHAERFRMTK